MKHSRKRRSAKISDAVFRGKKGEYTFEVYPLTAEMPETSAVFILSRRKVHRTGHISHAVSCLGETGSVPAEVKKHKKAKCVKRNLSDVICILREDSESRRQNVLGDIAEARSISCLHGVFDPSVLKEFQPLPKQNAKQPAGIAPPVPLPLKPVRRKRVDPAPQVAEPEAKPARRTRSAKAESPKTKRKAVSAKQPEPAKRPKAVKKAKIAKPAKPARSVVASKQAKPAAVKKPAVQRAAVKKPAARKARAVAVKKQAVAAPARPRSTPKRAAAVKGKTKAAARKTTRRKAA